MSIHLQRKPQEGAPVKPKNPVGARTAKAWSGVRWGWTLLRAAWGWVPVTLLATLATPILYVLCKYGSEHKDSVLLALTRCGLLLVVVAMAMVFWTALFLRMRLWIGRARTATLRFEAGASFRTGFCLGRWHW